MRFLLILSLLVPLSVKAQPNSVLRQYGVVFVQTADSPPVDSEAHVGHFATLPLPPPFDYCSYTYRPGEAYPYRWDTAGQVWMKADSIGCYPLTFNLDILLWSCPYGGTTYAARPSIYLCIASPKQSVGTVEATNITVSVQDGRLKVWPEEYAIESMVTLYNALGRQIFTKLPGDLPPFELCLPKGLYFYRVISAGKEYIGKALN